VGDTTWSDDEEVRCRTASSTLAKEHGHKKELPTASIGVVLEESGLNILETFNPLSRTTSTRSSQSSSLPSSFPAGVSFSNWKKHVPVIRFSAREKRASSAESSYIAGVILIETCGIVCDGGTETAEVVCCGVNTVKCDLVFLGEQLSTRSTFS
jgi:hypothetical protein